MSVLLSGTSAVAHRRTCPSPSFNSPRRRLPVHTKTPAPLRSKQALGAFPMFEISPDWPALLQPEIEGARSDSLLQLCSHLSNPSCCPHAPSHPRRRAYYAKRIGPTKFAIVRR